MSMSRISGLRSLDGALVKVSCRYRNMPAARRKLFAAASSPSGRVRSWRAPSWVYRAPRLKRTHAFSNATVRWQLGVPVRESYLWERKLMITSFVIYCPSSCISSRISIIYYQRSYWNVNGLTKL